MWLKLFYNTTQKKIYKEKKNVITKIIKKKHFLIVIDRWRHQDDVLLHDLHLKVKGQGQLSSLILSQSDRWQGKMR